MGCCISKQESSSPSPPSISLSNGGPCSAKAPDLNRVAVKSLKQEIEPSSAKPGGREENPKIEKEKQNEEMHENGNAKKEVFVIKHRKSHERSRKTDPADSPASAAEEKSVDSNPIPPAAAVVRTSSCTKEEVDAILIQCGRLSRSNSSAAKARRYSGTKRSFDFDQNERGRGGDAEEADAEDAGEDDEERRIHRHRHRGSPSPRERRRRTPSREREDSKSHRSGSRERGTGGGSRRVSRSPGRRSEINPIPNPNNGGTSGSSVNSGNNRPGKLVSVPATDKTSLAMDKSYNGEPSIKRITVKRNVGEGPRTAASPRSQSPSRAAGNNPQPPAAGAAPSLSRSSSRKAEHSPYRRNPLGEVDPNSLACPPSSKGDKMGNKKTMNKDNEGQGSAKESGNFVGQKSNTRIAGQVTNCRAASPSRVTKQRQETAEECKVTSSGVEQAKPQAVSRSRSSRQSRDFDFSPEALLSNNGAGPVASSYTALLLEDIHNFHQKSVNVNVNAFTLPPCVTKACSIVEAVADLNSTTNTSPVVSDQHQRNEFKFTASSAVEKADLIEPSFEKYVTVKRGGSLEEDMDEQESSGSNSFTGSSGLLQRQGFSSSSWEPNSADSTDRWSSRSNNTKERDRSPLGFERKDANLQKQEGFDPLKKGTGRRRGVVDSSSSSAKTGVLQATTTRVAASM
ncbi:PREDICTED: uncharacterized protein At1g65710 [Tarenaya hassleriana]|uniref:uncharacterized protein At1g65710 n=1 Tax=Tarenaya hassleriana TaxID=28532 RepID=UPI00053C6F23|nr:PREDICTED: uncharacterized protein At1g65710 [Tarenaya hassleriana]